MFIVMKELDDLLCAFRTLCAAVGKNLV